MGKTVELELYLYEEFIVYYVIFLQNSKTTQMAIYNNSNGYL